MIAYHLAGHTYGWVLSAHQNAASIFSSVVTIFVLVSMYVLLCLMSTSTTLQDEMEEINSQRDIVTEYLMNHKDAPPEQITYCAAILASALPKPNSQRTREQVGAFINLLISFGLGLMILIVLSAVTLICYPRRADSDEENSEERRASRGFRLLTLGLLLRRYHVKLQAEDASSEGGNGDDEPTAWLIPKPGVPNDSDTDHQVEDRRRVSDRCAICLEHYLAGDKVAYSSNRNCPHVFHEKCVSAWILSSASTNQQCPCCRQTFLSMQDLPDVAKKIY